MTAESNQIPESEYQRILDEGKNEGRVAAARVLMAIGTDIELIIQTTGLSELEVVSLQNQDILGEA